MFRQINGNNTVSSLSAPILREKETPGDLSDIGGPVIPAAAIDPSSTGLLQSCSRTQPARNIQQLFLVTPMQS